MDVTSARTLFSMLGDDLSLFGYGGRFPDEHSARLIELAELLDGSVPDGRQPRAKTGYVMVEAYQNVIRHRATPPGDDPWAKGRSLFLMRTGVHGHDLITRNRVTAEQAGLLQKVLEGIKGQDAAGLKRLFMEGIQRSSMPGQRGAGLGLIEMARRSEGDLHWELAPLPDGQSLFAFRVGLGRKPGAQPQDGGFGEALEEQLLQQRIHLLHVGRWTPELGQLLVNLSQAEVQPKAGRTAEREGVWGLVSSVILPLVAEGPVLLALHGRERLRLSLGGIVDQAQAGGFHGAMRDTDVEFSFGDGPGEGRVLALVHVPW